MVIFKGNKVSRSKMECSMTQKTIVTFSIDLKPIDDTQEDKDRPITVSHSVELPLSHEVNMLELTHHIITKNNLSPRYEKEIFTQLSNFIEKETNIFYERAARAKMKLSSATDLMSEWGVILKETIRLSKPDYRSLSRDTSSSFPSMYHKLVHSGTYTTSVLDLENSYALAISQLIEFRDKALRELHIRQGNEMEELLSKLGISKSEKDVNELSAAHLMESESLLNDCNRQITRLKSTQIAEFRDWIKKLYEDYERGPKSRGTSAGIIAPSDSDICCAEGTGINMEESFTINLGAQLKTCHNLRLIACDILSLCRIVSPSG